MNYMTMLFITRPLLAANNRGENNGTNQTLQVIETRGSSRTVISGYSIRYAIRENINAEGGKCWRVPDPDPTNPSGFLYHNKEGELVRDKIAAVPDDYFDWDDTALFGDMGIKGKDVNAKRCGAVKVSVAISTTPWDGNTAFVRGLKQEDGKLNPFSCERHFTRYQFTSTISFRDLRERPEAVGLFVDGLRNIQAGGNHSSNATDLIPDLIIWRTHNRPGTGGLYLAGGLDYDPNEPVDPNGIIEDLHNLGHTNYRMAGKGHEMTIHEGLNSIKADALMYAKGE